MREGIRPIVDRQGWNDRKEKVSKLEQRKPERNTEQSREGLLQEERKLRNQVQASVTEWFQSSHVDKIPRWVRAGILLSRLFAVETAAAQDLSPTPEPSVPPISDATRWELSQYVGDETIGVHFEREDPNKLALETIDEERLTEDRPIIFEKRVDQLFFHDELPATAMPKEGDPNWKVSLPIGGTEEVAILHWTDKYGNDLMIFRSINTETQTCEQQILVEPAIAYAEPGTTPDLRRLPIDLSAFGGKEIQNAFWYRELPAVELIGGNQVYSSGVDNAEVGTLLAEYGVDLQRGSESVDALFGYHQPAKIILSEDYRANGTYSGFGSINLNTGLFYTEDIPAELRHQVLEEVVEHEQFHYRDHQYRISESEQVQTVFASASPEVLQELNESVFTSEGFGGHAEDNEREFVATMLNNIDNDQWKTAVQALSLEARTVYRNGLLAVRDQISMSHVTKVAGTPPIVNLLNERIDAIPLDHTYQQAPPL